MSNRIELLAPAKDSPTAQAAILCGADAVPDVREVYMEEDQQAGEQYAVKTQGTRPKQEFGEKSY